MKPTADENGRTPDEREFAALCGELETARANTATVLDALRRRARAGDVNGARAMLATLKRYADTQSGKYVRLEEAAESLRQRLLAGPRPPDRPKVRGHRRGSFGF